MNYLSVCDGIGAAHVAWKPLGWRCVGASEIAPFPKAVVEYNHPEIPSLGDMTKHHEWNIEHPDLVCGGTPCQSFSVAGLRAGLADPRGNLALVFLGIVDQFRPTWVVWENVPGVYSATSHDAPDPRLPDLDGDQGPGDGETFVDTYDADEDHAFACFLAGLQELGYGVSYRTLDAQYFGVAQRRRRPFVVGYLGDWRPAEAVLLEPESMSGDPAPGRGKGQGVAATVSASPPSRRNGGSDPTAGHFVAGVTRPLTAAMGTKWNGNGDLESSLITQVAHTLKGEGFDASEDGTGRVVPLVMSTGQGNAEIVSDGEPSLTCNHEAPILMRMREGKEGGGKGPLVSNDQSLTLATANDQVLAYGKAVHTTGHQGDRVVGDGDVHPSLSAQGGNNGGGSGALVQRAAMQVRRLTPRECERLQAFPDNYTAIPWGKKPASECPDGPRYKGLGNSWATVVPGWIGRRIGIVMEILDQLKRAA